MALDTAVPPQVVRTWPDRLARHLLLRRLRRLRRGQVVLREADGARQLGEESDLTADCHIRDAGLYRALLWGGTLGAAEAYFRGAWECDDLTALFRIFTRNLPETDRLDGRWAWMANLGQQLLHACRRNTLRGSRRNIHAHYDLGNEFFRLWLDDTLAYSSGIFRSPQATLKEASVEKFDRVCRKLDLRPTDRVLEIGSGWGGFALHAARYYGCHVTTTTISQQQYDAVAQRIRSAGLADRITLLKQDYRQLRGQFDKLVSIEMLEAVGHRYLDVYFRCCGDRLRPDGSALIQTIVMPERRHARYLRSVDFIRRYIFPGGSLPSLGSILKSVGRTSDLRFVQAVDFAPHYAETARRWRQAFQQRRHEIQALGYPERFVRMWHYYLCYCEAVFEERYVGILQIQLDKPQCRRDALRPVAQAAEVEEPSPWLAGQAATQARSHAPSPAGAL